VKSQAQIYVLHRIGLIFGFAGALFWAAFSIENLSTLGEPIGRGLFFSSPGLILIAGPLILGLSRQDSFRFLLFELSLFGTYGLLALGLPADILPRGLSILTIVLLVLLIGLKRSHRNPHILDVKANLSPSTFIESMALFAVSFAIAFLLQLLGRCLLSLAHFPVQSRIYSHG
jgi:uncharacterized membrane protein AbrB (regulator of aidB expression)